MKYACDTPISTQDFDEFGWYMADTAWNLNPSVEGASSKLPGVISYFEEELEDIQTAADPKAAAVARLMAALDANADGQIEASEFITFLEGALGKDNVSIAKATKKMKPVFVR